MKIQRHFPRLVATSALLPAFLAASVSHAQGVLQSPGSLLVFGEYDSSPGHDTLLTVTNTNHDDTPAGAGLAGTVIVRFVYVDASTCLLLDRTHLLTPSDTLTVLASQHNPNSQSGYMYAFATAPVPSVAGISWNWLIGSATVTDGLAALSYSADPFVYRSAPALAQGALTDLDGDGRQDFDDNEYESVADVLHFPRFTGQDVNHTSRLVLLNLSGTGFETLVNLLVFNDTGQVFSGQFAFGCWSKTPLSTVSGLFGNAFLQSTTHDPLEPVGAPAQETGWFSVDGVSASSRGCLVSDPAILGLLIEAVGTDAQASIPFATGSQANGTLVHFGPGCP